MHPRAVRSFISKPDLVSTTLIYPMTMTTDADALWGLGIVEDVSAPLAQQTFQVQTSASTIRYSVPVTGGPVVIGADMRVAHAAGGAYAAYNGSATVPCLELPDGTGQGSKIWSGTGAPAVGTIGTPTTGDYYWRRWTTAAAEGAATLIAAETSSAGTTATSITVGTGSSLRSGAVLAGDLLLVCAENTVTTETCTVGADTGITAASGDGGAKYNDGTRRIHFFSHVVQSGDISSGTVTASAFTNNTGNGRRLTAWVYRHGFGFPTTGSKHGCTLVGSDNNSDTAITAASTRTVTGPSSPSVSMCAAYASASSTQPTFYWDAGNSSNKSSDSPGATNANAHVSVKAGLGTNTSGATGYTTGGSSCEITPAAGTWGTLLGNWATNTAVPSNPDVLYVYNGSAWEVVF